MNSFDVCFAATFVDRLSVALWSGSAFGLCLLWTTSASLHRSLVGLGEPELLPTPTPAMVGQCCFLNSVSSRFFLPLEPSALMNAFIKLRLSGEAFPIDIGGTKTLRMMRFLIPNLYLSHRIFQKHFVTGTFFTICCKSIPFSTITRGGPYKWLSETGSFALDCHGIEHPKLVEERLRRPHSYGPACASLVTVIVLGTEGAFEETTVTEQMMDFRSSPIRVVSDTRN